MSIQLPRSHKELHFTGSCESHDTSSRRSLRSVRALAAAKPVNALGQERPKGPPPPPPARVAPPPMPSRSVILMTTPEQPLRLTTARGHLASMDEDLVTEALDRDEINAALFPIARRENASQPAPNLPVPNFRSAEEAKAHHAEPKIIHKKPTGGTLPLGVWLMAALVAGIVSFQLAPQAAETVSGALRALESR